ncbi:hypothetical protein F5Y12DRAFT_784923 [Xylaria sp. FL1777]|nr:hypothetical protein F5Y12DRAFT_784923 [Xylaria sp. FL1777]
MSLLVSLVLLLASVAATACGQQCKNIPGDPNWPSQEDWASLNETTDGRLIATVPLASVCHSIGSLARFNGSECDILKGLWDYSEVHFEAPASIMPAWYQESCNPFSPTSEPCELGKYASYSINVNGVDDILAGIRFSQNHSVRLVVKNTGHDGTGKSTGTGALSLWMKNLKDREIIHNYQSSYYTGPAIKLGAGVLGLEAYEAADAEGYRVTGGNCPSVGIVGGYTQGGGHSQMGSVYGMGADNILEWEVVTTDGEHLIATPKKNSDLYWALSGGGGGTYGVVVSMTARLHPDGPIGGGYLTFDNKTVGTDAFWHAVGVFNSKLPEMLDAGNTTIVYSLANNTFGVYNIAADGRDADEVRAILQPALDDLESLGVPYNCTTHQSATFLEHLRRDYSPFPDGPFTTSGILGGRLIPRSLLLDTEGNDNLTQILRDTASRSEYAVLMQSLNVGSPAVAQVSDNAVLPAWRKTAVQLILSAGWDWSIPRAEMVRREGVIANELTPRLIEITPDSGSYLNEANMQQIDWQDAFFGQNYQRLLRIKKKYDPKSLLYAAQAVGSEAWKEDAQGRLCKS